jgi:transposase
MTDPPPGSTLLLKDESKPTTSAPGFDLQTHLHRIFGLDLTQVPGINVLTTQTLLAEIGPDFSHFANGPALTSWLGLCPDNRVSGRKVLSVKTRKVKNRAATAHKLARIVYHMVTTGHAYDETICAQNEVQNCHRMEARLRKQARELGLQLVAI